MPSIKALIPLRYKQCCKFFLHKVKMLCNGNYFKLASKHPTTNNLYLIKKIEQKLNNTSASTNKKNNIQLAINKINNLIIPPNQLFSFWYLVGNPSTKNGYEKSRAIVGNMLQQEVGGGLCQLSGLVYFLALHAGMYITERHHHSVDIYTDEERFTPLGSDATVVYGYKDLQFKNTLPYPIYLQLQIINDVLVGTILSTTPTNVLDIKFSYQKNTTTTLVTTSIYDAQILLNSFSTSYKKI
jgi:vancomycin resistance protein VanW